MGHKRPHSRLTIIRCSRGHPLGSRLVLLSLIWLSHHQLRKVVEEGEEGEVVAEVEGEEVEEEEVEEEVEIGTGLEVVEEIDLEVEVGLVDLEIDQEMVIDPAVVLE